MKNILEDYLNEKEEEEKTEEEIIKERYLRRKIMKEDYMETYLADEAEADKNRLKWIPRDWVENALLELHKAQMINGIQQARLKLDIDVVDMRKYAEFVKDCDLMFDCIQRARKAIAHRFTDLIDAPEKYCETEIMHAYQNKEMDKYFDKVKTKVLTKELEGMNIPCEDVYNKIPADAEGPDLAKMKVGDTIRVAPVYPASYLQERLGKKGTEILKQKEEEDEKRTSSKRGRPAKRGKRGRPRKNTR